MSQWARANLGDDEAAIAIDGKGLRGSHGEEVPGVRAWWPPPVTGPAGCWPKRGQGHDG
ncbi:MAG: hypothetical protein M3N68_07610 [Actinomycetota bacterium]|nr:hypothetical protein [Actinomycetota bacterium]